MNQTNNLNFRIIGQGHPIVFLHGFLESISMWDYLDLENAPFQSILIDLPGHGMSPLLDDAERPSLEFMTTQVRSVLNQLSIENYNVVGHSMGGYVALLLKEMDDRCEKVVLLNSNFWEDSEEKKKDRIRVADIALKSKDLFVNESIPGLFYRHGRKDSEVLDLINEAKKMTGVAIAYASLAMRIRQAKAELIRKYSKDFMIVQGLHDPIISIEKLKEEIGNMNISAEILKKSGHMAHIEEPAHVLEIIVEFLK